jgi:hypothetical protein
MSCTSGINVSIEAVKLPVGLGCANLGLVVLAVVEICWVYVFMGIRGCLEYIGG